MSEKKAKPEENRLENLSAELEIFGRIHDELLKLPEDRRTPIFTALAIFLKIDVNTEEAHKRAERMLQP